MQLPTSVAVAIMLAMSSLGVEATKSKQQSIVNCYGSHDFCTTQQTTTQSPQVSPQWSPTVSVPAPVPKRKRGISELFYGDNAAVYRRFAAKQAHTGGKSSKGGASEESGKQLFAEDIASMISNGEALPQALQGAVAAIAKKEGLHMPDPSSLKPTPAKFLGHPCTEALKHLQAGEIHPMVEKAARSAWGGGQDGKSSKGSKGDKTSPAGGASHHASSGKVHARDASYLYDELDARDAYADEELYARDAYAHADPDADYDLYSYILERDAEPVEYAVDTYNEIDLFSRDAEAGFNGFDFREAYY